MGVSMWTVKWWKDVAERSVRTFAATLVGWITVGGSVVGFEDLTWSRGLSIAGVATIVSVLLAISTHTVTGNGPSFNSVYKDDKKTSGEDQTDAERKESA